MDVALAIINYNTRKQLRRCLDSLPEELDGHAYRTLVIDNASSDGSATMVTRRYGNRFEVVANKANLGFGRAVNQALEQTDSTYLLVLNADIEVEPGAIEALVEFMDRTPDAGMAGGKLLDADGEVQPSCRRFYTASAVMMRRTPLGMFTRQSKAERDHLMVDFDHDEERVVDWIQGACLMIRREAAEAVGAMDERFFLYFEDVDLAKRLGEAGHKVYYVPQARFSHGYRRGSHGGLINIERLHHLCSALRYMNKHSRGGRAVLRVVRESLIIALLLLDLIIFNGGFLICLVLRDLLGGELPAVSTQISTYVPLLGGANLLLFVMYTSTGLYRVERSLDWLGTVAQTVKAVTWVALAGSVLLFFAPAYREGFVYSRLLLILYYFCLILGTAMSRLAIKAGFRWFWRRHLLLRRMLVVGEVEPSRSMVQAIAAEPLCGYEVTGTLPMPDDNGDDLDPAVAIRFRQMVQDHNPGGIIFAAQHHSFRSYVPLVLESHEKNLEVHVASSLDVFPYAAERTHEICGFPAADVTHTSLYRVKLILKRLGDIAISLAGTLICAPFILLLGLAVKLQDGGPIFFLQKRFGRLGRPFTIIKLRTMQVGGQADDDANIAEGPLTLIPNDPRVTPLGRWLRRHKVDELPQLLNVLKGDMSMVGPRPPMEDELRQYSEWQKGRLFVKPGLTGLWQIDKQRKWRFNEMVELDLKYILTWSLLLDYSVMLRTIQVVLRGS